MIATPAPLQVSNYISCLKFECFCYYGGRNFVCYDEIGLLLSKVLQFTKYTQLGHLFKETCHKDEPRQGKLFRYINHDILFPQAIYNDF